MVTCKMYSKMFSAILYCVNATFNVTFYLSPVRCVVFAIKLDTQISGFCFVLD